MYLKNSKKYEPEDITIFIMKLTCMSKQLVKKMKLSSILQEKTI